jgi:hypothetical protein
MFVIIYSVAIITFTFTKDDYCLALIEPISSKCNAEIKAKAGMTITKMPTTSLE